MFFISFFIIFSIWKCWFPFAPSCSMIFCLVYHNHLKLLLQYIFDVSWMIYCESWGIIWLNLHVIRLDHMHEQLSEKIVLNLIWVHYLSHFYHQQSFLILILPPSKYDDNSFCGNNWIVNKFHFFSVLYFSANDVSFTSNAGFFICNFTWFLQRLSHVVIHPNPIQKTKTK